MFLAFYLWLLSGAAILSWIAQRTQFFPGDMTITKGLPKTKLSQYDEGLTVCVRQRIKNATAQQIAKRKVVLGIAFLNIRDRQTHETLREFRLLDVLILVAKSTVTSSSLFHKASKVREMRGMRGNARKPIM